LQVKTRRRYLALRIDSDGTFNSKDLMDAVWDSFLRIYGEYGASKAGLTLIDYDAERKLAIIRVTHTEVEKARVALATITSIATKPAAIHVLKVSGTIKALRRKLKAMSPKQSI